MFCCSNITCCDLISDMAVHDIDMIVFQISLAVIWFWHGSSWYQHDGFSDITGCNLISDMAVHDIDMMVWLTSCSEPESVYVMTHIRDETLQKIREPDAGVISIKFKNGMIATIDVFRESVYGYDIRAEARPAFFYFSNKPSYQYVGFSLKNWTEEVFFRI